MACTRTLFASLNFSRPFLGYQPLTIGGQEPAVTAANVIKQAMLGAPFAWPFNRSELTFVCAANQDYVIAAPDFGFIESWTIADEEGKTIGIGNKTNLAVESNSQQPGSASLIFDDNSGNITARFNSKTDQTYTVTGQYQRKASLLTSIASLWTPIPDEKSYIYEFGFLAVVSLLLKDARYPIFTQQFMAHLLSAQDGIDELQKNIFIGDFLQSMRAMERSQAGTNLAVTGRAKG